MKNNVSGEKVTRNRDCTDRDRLAGMPVSGFGGFNRLTGKQVNPLTSIRWGLCSLFLTALILFVACSCLFASELSDKPKIGYTLISSDDMSHINEMLRKGIKAILPDANEQYLDYNDSQAKEYIDKLAIDFIPYIIYDESIVFSDKFFHMARNNMIDKQKGYYIIPPQQLKAGEVMYINRKREPGTLYVFVMGMCPSGKSAEAILIDLIERDKLNVKLVLRYIANIDDFGISSPNGPDEIREDLRQIALQKYYPDKFLDYLMLKQHETTDVALKEIGVKPEDLDARRAEAIEILKQDYEDGKALGINRSPTFLWENIYLMQDLRNLRERAPFKKEVISPKSSFNLLAGRAVPVDFFFSYRCEKCAKVKNDIMPSIKAKYGDKIEIKYHNISDPEELRLMIELEKEYGVLSQDIPVIFLPTAILSGNEIEETLGGSIEDILKGQAPAMRKKDIARAGNPVLERFSAFNPGIITLAGLADGINPCAFTALVFFITFLGFHSYSRINILRAGWGFLTGVFLTYLLLGLGGAAILGTIEKFYIFSNIIKYSVAIFAIILGGLALYDFIVYKRTGKADGLKLKLPAAVKNFIQLNISRIYRDKKEFSDNKRIIALAFLSGVVISLLESVCTGQIYLPVITLIMKEPSMRVSAFLYLLLYNLAFILPLGIIFMLAYKGISSKVFEKFTIRYLGVIKLLYMALFFALGAFLLFS